MKSFQLFRLDTANHCLWGGEERGPIPPKAYDVLRFLVENPGRLVTQDELLEALWTETYVNPEILRKYILDIRKILGDRPDKPVFIETVTKRGYRFIAAVIDESATEPPDLLTSYATDEKIGPEGALSEQQRLSGRSHLRKLAMVSMLAVVAAAATSGHFWVARNKAHAPSPQNTFIAVLAFAYLRPGKAPEYF